MRLGPIYYHRADRRCVRVTFAGVPTRRLFWRFWIREKK